MPIVIRLFGLLLLFLLDSKWFLNWCNTLFDQVFLLFRFYREDSHIFHISPVQFILWVLIYSLTSTPRDRLWQALYDNFIYSQRFSLNNAMRKSLNKFFHLSFLIGYCDFDFMHFHLLNQHEWTVQVFNSYRQSILLCCTTTTATMEDPAATTKDDVSAKRYLHSETSGRRKKK